MKRTAEPWYVRLPDGQVFWAANTRVVRHHLGSGRLPPGSRVRRSPEEEWVALEWTDEFADLAKHRARKPNGAVPEAERKDESSPEVVLPQSGVASRLDPRRLQTVGLRRMLREMQAALDLTLVKNKLLPGAAVGMVGGLLAVLAASVASVLQGEAVAWSWATAAAGGLLLAGFATALLSQTTYVELSQLRPARWRESKAYLLRNVPRCAVALLILAGLPLAAILFLRQLPASLANSTPEAAAPAIAIGVLLLEVVLWPLVACALVIGPVVVVEETSVVRSLRVWGGLVRQNAGRLLLYETLAVGLGVLFTVAFGLPLLLAYQGVAGGSVAVPVAVTFQVLAGLVGGILFAFLVVANVFIYLNLRYEQKA